MNLKKWLLTFACIAPAMLYGQYYDQGVAPASIRWSTIRTPHNRIIFPSDYRLQAIRVMHYLDTVRGAVGYGYRYGALRMPVVLQTHNFASNGLVMRAPTRMELIVPPPAAMAPEPWLKQLVTHEARHTVQYNQVNKSTIKGVGWLLGDQGYLLGIALFPIWGMEGDAVLAETELSTFGRGLQPSFTIDYRAMLDGDRWKRWVTDKWFCGSFKDHIPDHYQVGYQISSYAWTKYGENIWDKVAHYATRYPFFLITTKISLWKYYRTTAMKLRRETFEDLDRFWDSLPRQQNSARIIPTPVTSHTTYSSPLLAGGRIIALKRDMDRPERIVSVDPATGEERVLHYTGIPNSPLAYDGTSRIYWSELRQSTVWTQKVNSQLCWADLQTGRRGTVKGLRQALFPVALPGGGLAWVQYEYDGSYTIRQTGSEQPLWHFPLPVSIHGLAADAKTRSIYFIAVDEGGMYIGALDDQGIRTVRPAAYATINDLRAHDGRLYFTSTQSGRDEAHAIDALTGREVRLTTSEYGSFAPAYAAGGTAVTTYTREGYRLAFQADSGAVAVPFRVMPENVVNPPRKHWDMALNMDSIAVPDTTSLPVKRYRKGLHLLNFHSWAPAAFDPDQLMSEQKPDIHLGVTAISQDLLNSTILTMRYAYVGDKKSFFAADLQYLGWTPKFELSAKAGGGDRLVYSLPEGTPPPAAKKYFEADLRTYLPLYLSMASRTRVLQPSVDFQYNNALIYEQDGTVSHGLHKLLGEIYYSDNARLAMRDFLPRTGFAVRGDVAVEPTNDRFSKLWTAYARGYLPGVAPHHSTMLRAAYQWQSSGTYHFRQKELFPTGADYDFTAERYMAFALDYQLPVAYPDWGVISLFYIKRVRINAAGNYARYRPFIGGGEIGPWQQVWSYGGDIILDTNLLRAPASATNYFRISIYHPSDRKGVFVGVDMSLPF